MNDSTRFENSFAAEHAAIIITELVEYYLPRMAEVDCDDSVPLAMRLVSDPRGDHAPVRFEPFFLSEAEVLRVYRATVAS